MSWLPPSISSGILDNDPKGLSGRGTKYWLEVTAGGKLERYEYHILDVIEGKFDPEAVKKPAREEMRRYEHALKQADKEKKELELAERKAAVLIDPAIDTIATSVIANNPKVVAEYKSGKDKALNALVGMVIGEVRKQKLTSDAFTINTLLKQKLQG